MTRDWHVEDADGRVERIAPRYVEPCEDCHGQGWVSVPCPRDPECAGCEACDRRCRSCDAGRTA